MSLPDLVKAVRSTPYYVSYGLPEVGNQSDPLPCLMASARGKSVAWCEPHDGAGPWRVRETAVADAIRAPGGIWRITLAQDFPTATLTFRPANGDAERNDWLAAMSEIDDDDAEIATEMEQRLNGIKPEPERKLNRFEFVRWSIFDADVGRLIPAGVALRDPERHNIVVRPFTGHENDAEGWNTRFKRVPADALATINSVSGRDESFSAPEYIKATSFDDAVERSLYRVARDHYAKTGEALLK